MKKFITYISMQNSNLKKLVYLPMDGELKGLSDQRKAARARDFETSYPVMCLIDDYVAPNDQIEVICMLAQDNESVKRNYLTLKQELAELSSEIGFTYETKTVDVQPDEVAESHVRTFQSLVDLINGGDELFVCCTFGTKPIPIIEMMVLNYTYRLKKDVSIRSIVYGAPDWEKGGENGKIFDIRELFFMDQIVNQFAREGLASSEELIRRILNFDAE